MKQTDHNEMIDEDEDAIPTEFHVPDSAIGLRIDTWLSRVEGAPSRNRVQQLVKDGHVLVDGKKSKPSTIINGGEVVKVTWPGPEDIWPQPQDIPLDVVYDDESVIVINKQADLVVHPSGGHPDGTLVNALLHRFSTLPGMDEARRPGIVHRLDRDTTGLMIVAKTDKAMVSLSKQFADKTVKRTYLALVIGTPSWDRKKVDAPIGRDPINRLKRSIDGGFPRNAVSYFEVLQRSHQFALVRCQLDTGRTHQIRVHLASIGHPIVCDILYEGHINRCIERLTNQQHALKTALVRFGRPLLHSNTLDFIHPEDGRARSFVKDMPEDAKELIQLAFAPTGK